MRAFDWSATALGPHQRWPEPLKHSVALCVTSKFPIVMYWGPDRIMLYNDPCIPFLGEAKHPRYLGRPGREAWSDIWDAIGPLFERVESTGEATWSTEFQFFFSRNLPKEEVYVTFTVGPILSAAGTVDGFFCPCTEVTEKVVGARRLETLRKLGVEALTARTIDAACEMAATVLAENPHDVPFAAVYLVNEHAGGAVRKSVVGFPREEHPFPRAVAMAEGDDSPWPIAAALRSRRAEDTLNLIEAEVALPGGPWPEPASMAVVLPVFAQHESLCGVVVLGVGPRRVLDDAYRTFFGLIAAHIGTALSNAKAYEAEQKRAEVLTELDRAKTAFFSNVSHEFRTPLTLMLAPIEDMRGRVAAGAFAGNREALDLIHRNTLRLLKLVNTLLDFSRIEAGRGYAVYESIDLARYTADLAAVFRSAIERAGLTLTVDCPPLPGPVMVDREMWEKIVLNLLSNALKFTFAGAITVTLFRRGERVDLTVADTGVGIGAAELPHIFQRFHRVRGVRARTHEGTGIGLALVKELVKLHGGDVTVESAEGRGTTFVVSIPTGTAHIPPERLGAVRTTASTAIGATPFVEEARRWLPADPTMAGPAAAVAASPAVLAAAAANAGVHVLFADDNADMRQYVQHLLADRYRVTAVADGAAALDAAQREPPDLILADVMMPILDGFGLLHRLRGDPRLAAVPVVLLSARAGEDATVEGIRAGADDYLIKPFGAQELVARIDAQIRRRRAEDERQRLLIELSESRRLFEQMADASPDAIYVYDVVDGRTSYMSARAEQVIGYTADEVIARTYRFALELWHPDDASRLPEYRRRAATLADGEVFETEYRLRQPDNSYRWLRSRMAPLSRTENGQLQRLVGVTQDITDRKRAEEALRESEERFRSYFELGVIGMAITDAAKRILEVNDEMCRILGYERDELLHKTWAELTHPDDLAADVLQFSRVMAGEVDGYSLDKRWIRKDRGIIDATISVKCLRTADGSVGYFVALLQDISERTRANEALRRAHAELEWRVAERTARLTELNEGLLRLHEFSTHLLAQNDLQRILNDVLAAIIALQGADFGNIRLYRRSALEIVAHHGSGQEFLDYAVQSTPLASCSGEPLGIVSTHFRQPHRLSDEALRLTDLYARQAAEVIEHKRSEAALLEYQRQLQELTTRLIEAQETESKHVARELHDVFSQQLAAIGMETASLERRCSRSQHALRTSIRKITGQMQTLADDVHRMSRQIHPAILDDLGLSAAIRSESVAFSEQHRMPVEFHADDIPPGVPESVALCLYRVAQEALRNVGKHAGVSLVRVGLRLTTNGLALTVDDTGRGFDLDKKSGKRGLGLVSMEERLRMVQGTLTIRSKRGHGTSLVATVPLSR